MTHHLVYNSEFFQHIHRAVESSCMACLVAQSCLTLCNPMHRSPPGSSVQGILQARVLEWVATPPPGDLPDPRIKPASPTSAGGFCTISATWAAHSNHHYLILERFHRPQDKVQTHQLHLHIPAPTPSTPTPSPKHLSASYTSLWTCLSWTLHMYEIIKSVADFFHSYNIFNPFPCQIVFHYT